MNGSPYSPPGAYPPPPRAGGAGVRPARFTVIAVLNFAFSALAILFMIGALAVMDLAETGGFEGPPVTVIWVNLLVILLNTVLLIVGGIGLLLVRKWGWALCLAYGILAIAWNLIWTVVAGVHPFTVIGLVYPIVVVSLLLGRVSREAIV